MNVSIPLLHDLAWIALPVVLILPTLVVLVSETKANSSPLRRLIWTLAQLALPLIAFVLWLTFRRRPLKQ